MFDDELKELKARQAARKNIAGAIISFAIMWLGLIVSFFSRNYYNKDIFYSRIVPLILGMRCIALVLAALFFVRALAEIKKNNKRLKNAAAAAISFLVCCLLLISVYTSFIRPVIEGL